MSYLKVKLLTTWVSSSFEGHSTRITLLRIFMKLSSICFELNFYSTVYLCCFNITTFSSAVEFFKLFFVGYHIHMGLECHRDNGGPFHH